MKLKLFLSGLLCAGCLSAMTIVKDGIPHAVIHNQMPVSEKSLENIRLQTPEERSGRILNFAVRDLIDHIRKISGAELKTAAAAPKDGQPAIIISRCSTDHPDAFRLKITDNRIHIQGATGEAAAYGIYELLNRLGCDWVMPGTLGEVIPAMKTVTIDDLDYSSKPDFQIRCPWYSGGRNVHTQQERLDYDIWKIRHKMQTATNYHPLLMLGGHVSSVLFREYRKEFKAHPEMLALVRRPDGSVRRQGPQLETTNPRTLEIYRDYIRKMFKKKGWTNDRKVCIGVGPADGTNFSVSPESLQAGTGRTDPMTGEPDFTDLQILLCNQLLTSLEKEFPNLHLGFYLYSVHADYPIRYKPHPRTVIVLADISYSRMHSTLEPISKTRVYYRQIVEKWGKAGVPMFFRGYNWNLAENFLPFSKLKMWGEDLPYYHRLGVLGSYNESSKANTILAPSNYLEARLLWDSSQDWHQVLKEFCRKAYGEAAPWLEKYNLEVTRLQSQQGQEAGSYHSYPLIYDAKFIKKARKWFRKAERCDLSPMERERVAAARFPLEMLDRYLSFRKAFNKCDFTEAKELFDDMKSRLQAEIDKGQSLVCKSSVVYLNRFYGQPLETGLKYSDSPYRMDFQLPDKMITMLDPYNQGDLMGYFNPEIIDRDYIQTKTYSSTWDAQGFMGYRNGSVWYRTEIPTPKNTFAGLVIGGCDSIVKVWCNGKYIGKGQGFARAFFFDLTGTLKPEGRNLLAIQIMRFGNSEVGTGGLIYPSFLFSSDKPLPQQKNMPPRYRLLPGGAIELIK